MTPTTDGHAPDLDVIGVWYRSPVHLAWVAGLDARAGVHSCIHRAHGGQISLTLPCCLRPGAGRASLVVGRQSMVLSIVMSSGAAAQIKTADDRHISAVRRRWRRRHGKKRRKPGLLWKSKVRACGSRVHDRNAGRAHAAKLWSSMARCRGWIRRARRDPQAMGSQRMLGDVGDASPDQCVARRRGRARWHRRRADASRARNGSADEPIARWPSNGGCSVDAVNDYAAEADRRVRADVTDREDADDSLCSPCRPSCGRTEGRRPQRRCPCR